MPETVLPEAVKVVSCTIADLFNAGNTPISGTDIRGQIAIPEYQRPYLWKEKELVKLANDLEEYFNKPESTIGPLYYLGSIILHQKDGNLNIIDGQQRITTLALMQGVMGKGVPPMKFDSPISIFNIQQNFKLLEKRKIEKFDVSKINITLIVTQNEDDAYTFFETQNTGGVRLTGVDIIKAHHLREIKPEAGRQDRYAEVWEMQHSLATVIECLIKARRWNILDWVPVPSDRDIKGTKESIVQDFSEKTKPATDKKGYRYVQLTDNYTQMSMQSAPLAIRQPLANGENFIDYLSFYSGLYQRLFKQKEDPEIPSDYYSFNTKVIEPVDGTAFLKEFYEIAMMCYASRFGVRNIHEAAYWIFRICYSLRVSMERTVREDSIPRFIREKIHLFDCILHCFDHKELMEKLELFKYEFSSENAINNTVKARFIRRLAAFFNERAELLEGEVGLFTTRFDTQLKDHIKAKINGKQI